MSDRPSEATRPFHHVEWMDRAACAGEPDVTFYGTDGYNGGPDYARAWAFCRSCPVRVDCLDYAMATETMGSRRWGIWGGTTPEARRRLAGRPTVRVAS